jgi:hypothetical protein
MPPSWPLQFVAEDGASDRLGRRAELQGEARDYRGDACRGFDSCADLGRVDEDFG